MSDNAAHDERAIEGGGTGGESTCIFEETRGDVFNRQSLHAPLGDAEFQAIIPARASRRRIAHRTQLEERGCLVEAGKDRAGRQRANDPAADGNARATIITAQGDIEMVVGLGNGERSMLMLAGKHPPADECVEARIGIATRDVDAFVRTAACIPFDCDSMGGIFRAKPQTSRQPARSDTRKPNEADAGNGVAVHEFRPKRCG